MDHSALAELWILVVVLCFVCSGVEGAGVSVHFRMVRAFELGELAGIWCFEVGAQRSQHADWLILAESLQRPP